MSEGAAGVCVVLSTLLCLGLLKVLDRVLGGKGRPQSVRPPFIALKMIRAAHLDLIGSFGSAEVKMIKTLQYTVEMCQLSSLENACISFSCQGLSQILFWVGGRSYH